MKPSLGCMLHFEWGDHLSLSQGPIFYSLITKESISHLYHCKRERERERGGEYKRGFK